MVRIGHMANRTSQLNRRDLLGGLGAAALSPAMPVTAAAQSRPSLMLKAKPGVIALRPGGPDTPIWALQTPSPETAPRFMRGDQLEVTFGNELSVPALLDWRGIDGVASAEPLLEQAIVAAGANGSLKMPLRTAGTFLCDVRQLGDAQARPSRAWPFVVGEREPVAVDRDEVLLIEDWRLRPDGTAVAPGIDPKGTEPVTTINGQTSQDIPVRINERLRLRFINGFQRNVIAIKIENHDVRVMALDSQPAEPFQARNGALVLAPGGRVDVFMDATAVPGSASAILVHDGKDARPIARLVTSNEKPVREAPLPPAPALPSNGLPAQLKLKGASRFDLTLGGSPGEWVTPVKFAASAPPAFRVKASRTVVLALTNRADIATVFHLHGHHFRLLDRLDDGWKPFWLDTLAVEPGQTQRIAFLAETAGRWLIEAVAADWAAPRLVRWYGVE
jgi:FtsP/CotA-like multicopper oxidase with cupredoxin domain